MATKTIPNAYRSAMANAFAADLANEGYRIDPNANVAFELNVTMGAKTTGVGKQIPDEHLPPKMREEIRRKPMFAWFELTDVYPVTIQGRVYDSGGKLVMQTKEYGEFAVVERGEGADAAWKALASREVKLPLPRLYLRDAGNKRLVLPTTF
jgi:hypothetical protein